MADRSLRLLAEQALAAILDDSPDYPGQLDALARAPTLPGLCDELPELARELMVELRKLRPLPLWVRDQAPRALDAKQKLQLDGALCLLPPGSPLPPAQGRECWLEVLAGEAAAALRTLPMGWGLVVAGELHAPLFAELRRSSPLRALGARLGAGDQLAADLRLDLVVRTLDETAVAASVASAARTLWLGAQPESYDVPEIASSSGLVCGAEEALSWLLTLARRRARPRGSP